MQFLINTDNLVLVHAVFVSFASLVWISSYILKFIRV